MVGLRLPSFVKAVHRPRPSHRNQVPQNQVVTPQNGLFRERSSHSNTIYSPYLLRLASNLNSLSPLNQIAILPLRSPRLWRTPLTKLNFFSITSTILPAALPSQRGGRSPLCHFPARISPTRSSISCASVPTSLLGPLRKSNWALSIPAERQTGHIQNGCLLLDSSRICQHILRSCHETL